ncbi:MAG: PEP-utilizing enzyme [bacterium]
MKIINSQNFSEYLGRIGNKAKNLFIAQCYGLNIPKFEVLIDLDLTKQKPLLEIFNQLQANLDFKPNQKIILRSSASNEDSRTKTFAGIFESRVIEYNFTNFKTALKQILNPINKKLRAYDKSKNNISIIIQEYKIFDSSGVIFSLNPNKAYAGPLINANFGQPNNVVDGKSSFSIQLSLTGQPHQQLLKLFSKLQIKDLINKLILLKAVFADELDIEFGFIQNELFILQVRPISVFLNNSFSKLDSSNIRENFPTQVLPLTQSILQKIYFKTYHKLLLKSGVKANLLENNSFIFNNLLANDKGNLFYNLTSWFAMSQFLPGSKNNSRSLNQIISGKTEDDNLQIKFGMWFKLRYYAIVVFKILRHKFTINNYQKNTTKLINTFQNINFSRLSLMDLNKVFNELEYLGLKDSYIVAENDFLLMSLFDLIKKKLRLTSTEFSKFITSTSSYQVTSSSYINAKNKIYQSLGDLQKKFPDLGKNEFIKIVCFDQKNSDLRLQILDYINFYGSRFPQELDLSKTNPNPKTIVQFMDQFFLEKNTNYSFKTIVKKPKNQKWYVSVFNYLVKTREQNRLLRASYFDVLRSLFSQVGEQLHVLKFIENTEDVHYLTSDEIWNFINLNSVNFNLKDLIQIRKKQHKQKSDQVLFGLTKFPDFYNTKMTQNIFKTKSIESVDRLFGLSVSSGNVRAEVTILNSFPTKLKKNYGIIVTKNTDPGWIEIFPRIKGLILEGGGILSHASIICRELNIPCITDIDKATSKLKDGQVVELNADQGFVKL